MSRSEPDVAEAARTDDLPPAMRSLWRTFQLGYRAEPQAAHAVARPGAADDAARRAAGAVAEADRRWHDRRRPLGGDDGRRRAGGVGDGDVVPVGAVAARAAPLPRPGRDRARVARGSAAGDGAHDRAPRAARVPRPAGDAARPGVRARPHVHVAVLDARLAVPTRHHGAPARLGPPGAGAADRVRAARRSSCRRGGPRSSGASRRASSPTPASAGTCSCSAPPHRPPRRCG